MKKIFLLFLLGMMVLGISTANAEEDRMNAVSVNPLGQFYVFGPIVEYERLINESHGVSIGYSAISGSTPFSFKLGTTGNDYADHLKGTEIDIVYRYHFGNGFTYDGFWIGAGVNYLSHDYKSMTRYVPKAEVGKIWTWNNGFLVKLGFAVVNNGDFSKSVADKGGDAVKVAFLSQFDNVRVHGIIGIGWAF